MNLSYCVFCVAFYSSHSIKTILSGCCSLKHCQTVQSSFFFFFLFFYSCFYILVRKGLSRNDLVFCDLESYGVRTGGNKLVLHTHFKEFTWGDTINQMLVTWNNSLDYLAFRCARVMCVHFAVFQAIFRDNSYASGPAIAFSQI